MARSEYHLDTRIRRCHVPLCSQQRRLRHLTSIAARNMTKGPHSSATGTFFTLHLRSSEAEFYKSELDTDCVNPTWRNFGVSSFPDELNSSSCYVIVKVWLQKADDAAAPVLAIEWFTYFTGLLFYGEKVPKDAKRFQPNSLLFGTLEGYYGHPDCLLSSKNSEELEYPVKESIPVDPSNVRISYSTNTVNRIQTVQRAIKQTQASVRRTRAMIQERLKQSEEVQRHQAARELDQLKAAILREELERIRKRIENVRRKIAEQEQELQDFSTDQMSRFQSLKKVKDSLMEQRRSYYEARETLLKTTAQLVLRRKRLVSDLSLIYPIVEFPDKKGYSICGVYLPNAEDFAGHDETMISVGIGYVTHVLLMISWFLNVPLRYPLRYHGSQSYVTDHIIDKIPDKEREFPLFCRSREKTHFHYAVYLLNKNLGQLRYYLGLATNDQRATLANLYSLLELRLNARGDATHPSNNSCGPYPPPAPHQNLHRNGTVVGSSHFFVPPPATESNTSAELVADLRRELLGGATTPVSDMASTRALSCSLDKGLNGIVHHHSAAAGESGGEAPLQRKACRGSVPNLTLLARRLSSSSQNDSPLPLPLVQGQLEAAMGAYASESYPESECGSEKDAVSVDNVVLQVEEVARS